MKPKTKFEKRIIEIKDNLPPISGKIIRWTYKRFIQPVGFTSNGDICYCGNCGRSFPITQVIGAYIDDLKNRKKDPCGFCPRFQCEASYDWLNWEYSFDPKKCRLTFVKDLIFDTYCPFCKKRLEVHFSRRRKIKKTKIVSALVHYKGIQLWRNFNLIFEFTKGETYNCKSKDICVIWINENGTFRSVRNKSRGYNDHDSKGKVIPSLTNDDTTYTRWLIGKYCTNLYPEFDLADYLKIRGLSLLSSAQLEYYNRHYTGIFHEPPNSVMFIKYLLKYPYIETLMKQGDFETIHTFFSYDRKEFETILPSYLIIKRHRYKPADLNLWIDMILLYHKAGKDIRNPKFICPEDLRKGHEEAQVFYERERDKRRREEEEEWERIRPRDIWWFLDHHPEEEEKCIGNDDYLYQLAEQFGGLNPGWHIFIENFADETTGDIITLKRRINDQGLYYYPDFRTFEVVNQETKEERNRRFEKLKGKYRNIEFHDEELSIRTLNSWDEYYEEGHEMRNCVETNAYWNKPSTLVLSVRKGEERVADVEISLRTFKILQCWGPCNKPTPYREKIAKLIENNIYLIKERIGDK